MKKIQEQTPIDSGGFLHVVWVSASAAGNQQTMKLVRYTKTTVAYPTQANLSSAANWQAVTNVDDANPGYMPTVSTDTSAVPTAPVSSPGAGVSSPPFRLAVIVMTWAETGIDETSKTEATPAITLNSRFMDVYSLSWCMAAEAISTKRTRSTARSVNTLGQFCRRLLTGVETRFRNVVRRPCLSCRTVSFPATPSRTSVHHGAAVHIDRLSGDALSEIARQHDCHLCDLVRRPSG